MSIFKYVPLMVMAMIATPENLIAGSNQLAGKVVTGTESLPVVQARVSLEGIDRQTQTDQEGRFSLNDLPGGKYLVHVSKPGFSAVVITASVGNTNLAVSMAEEDQRLIESIVVTPGRYALKAAKVEGEQFLSQELIRHMPKFGDDLYRTVTTLPGTFGDNISAQFSVRGGLENETQVLIDGMEIYEPFHLKDFGGIFSILDPEAVGSLSLSTGGYTAEYGNRMSGVLEMQTLNPSDRRTQAGISFSNAGVMTQGTFADGRGQYLVSARRGYVDILLAMVNEDEDVKIPYLDSLGKIRYTLNNRHDLSMAYLLSDDEVDFSDQDEFENEEVVTAYGSNYVWTTLESRWTDTLQSRTVLYRGNVDRDRLAIDEEFFENDEFYLRDVRDLTYQGLKQDWSLALSTNHLLKFGWDYRDSEASYDYLGTVSRDDSLFGNLSRHVQHRLAPDGDSVSAYLTDRFFLGERLTVELGLRYDDHSWIDTDMVSPRLNLAYEIGDDTVVRLAGGRYYQPQGLQDLQVEDDVITFFESPYADQFTAAVEHRFSNGLEFRAEAYLKQYEDLFTRFQNIYDHREPFGEVEDDRIAIAAERGESRGMDLILRGRTGQKISWMVNYTWQEVEDEVDGEMIPRQWGQPHNVKAHLNWTVNRKWNMHFAWAYTSGWRTTAATLVPFQQPNGLTGLKAELGPLNGESLDDFHALDYRLTRNFMKADNKGFSFFLDLANVYARETPIGLDIDYYRDGNGNPWIDVDEETSLPLLPSLGFTWVF
ncbi:MAG: TonB-dependent receptor [Acidobacteriota bacterium]|nr:TonB-dependent receptor [Acidobacteriota bacterium]